MTTKYERAAEIGQEHLETVLEPRLVKIYTEGGTENDRRLLWSLCGNLHSSVKKLRDPFASWPTLDVEDRMALSEYHLANINKLIS
jgi:hypothetical protein